MAETLTIRTATSTDVVKVIERGPQGPAGPAGTGLETLTTQGDLLYRGATVGERLPIGTSGQVLKVSNGLPAWANESGAVTSVNGQTGSVTVAALNHTHNSADVFFQGLEILGAGNANTNGVYVYGGDLNGKGVYYKDKDTFVYWDSAAWTISYNSDDIYSSSQNTTTPWQVTSWSVEAGQTSPAPSSWDRLTGDQWEAVVGQRINPTLRGDAAGKNVGTGANDVAAGDDARFSDTRDPNAHASSHGAAGSDAITIATTQINDLGDYRPVKAAALGASDAPNSDGLSLVEELTQWNIAYPSAFRTALELGDAATADIGTAAGEVAEGDHTHELTALAATGATNGHVLTANGSGGVTFAAASGGVTAVNSTLADILSVSGSDLVADDLGSDKLYGWDDSASKAIGFTLDGLTTDGTTLRAAKVDIYTANDTWNKPAGAKMIHYLLISGGGGGGAGRRGATSTTRGGGAGGSGASVLIGWADASYFSNSETVTVGAGGAGGANSADDTNGEAGAAGGHSQFGSALRTRASNGGGGGTNTGGGSGGAATSAAMILYYSDSALAAGGGAAIAGTSTIALPTGGGGGGTIDASNNRGQGAAGGAMGRTNMSMTVAGGAAVTNAAGNNGNTSPFNFNGTGGGGGGCPFGGAGTTGGNGGNYGGGGGGGSAATNGSGGSTAGGNGGSGIVVITTYF